MKKLFRDIDRTVVRTARKRSRLRNPKQIDLKKEQLRLLIPTLKQGLNQESIEL